MKKPKEKGFHPSKETNSLNIKGHCIITLEKKNSHTYFPVRNENKS